MPTEDEKEANRRKAEQDPDFGKQPVRYCGKHSAIRLDGRGNCSLCTQEADARRRRGKKP